MTAWNHLRAAARGLAFLGVNAALVPLYLLLHPLGRQVRRALIELYCRGTRAILGVRVELSGAPFRACPTLFVANHVSYLDIAILGGIIDASFIGKSEVASWPLFGQLGRLTGALFIHRRRVDALIQRNVLAGRMRAGESFVLFGEGTSSNGLSVDSFKTSLLSVAEPWVMDRPVAVQAVTLAFARLADGVPIDRNSCDLYAWHGDAEFLPHLWRVLGSEGMRVALAIDPPVLSWSVDSRKSLGVELQSRVAARLATLRAQAARMPLPKGEPAAQSA